MAADEALVLAGHGSHESPASAAPLYYHADRIRDRGDFGTVRVGFWKGQPSLAEVLGTIEATATYVVPVLTSEGYFADTVFPRELGLEGRGTPPSAGRVAYTDPVGTHDRVRDVVLDRVEEVLSAGPEPGAVGLVVVGHGTDRHDDSGGATVRLASRLRALDRFAAVEALFLDQEPSVAEWAGHLNTEAVVIVPFFVADGPHVTEDVPRAVGLPTVGDPFGGPTSAHGREVWYTPAVGTSPNLTAVVLERAVEAGATVGESGDASRRSAADRAFLSWLEPESSTGAMIRTLGELAIAVEGARFEVRHRCDRGIPASRLDELATASDVRNRTQFDADGQYRPLRSARTLPRGWVIRDLGLDGLLRAVRAVYPASIDHWHRARNGTLEPTPFAAVVDRQTGRYRDLDGLGADPLRRTVEATCGNCVRSPTWHDDEAASTADDIPCPQPCSVFLEAARSATDSRDRSGRPGTTDLTT